MNKAYILFDLDGTLTDPGLGITNSVAHALAHFGITVTDRTQLYRFIGPPLIDSFMEYYGFTEEQAVEAVKVYREYFAERGWAENTVYEGIETLLVELTAAGKILLVATSKPQIFAERILTHFGLDKYFTHICGVALQAPRGYSKADVIREALAKAGVTDLSTAVMVGDRHHDIDGAKAVGLDSIGVLYGYGDREEHEKAGADVIAESVDELYRLLLS
ncbi:MAG: HAD family hydrolase [Clostridia bacterium]|nr:HAD family hydrolase [Clostridia bacterium]